MSVHAGLFGSKSSKSSPEAPNPKSRKAAFGNEVNSTNKNSKNFDYFVFWKLDEQRFLAQIDVKKKVLFRHAFCEEVAF